MTQEQFVGILVGTFTIGITVLMLAAFEHEAASKVAYDCVDPTERERVREITLNGIDDGLRRASALIYDIWRLELTPEPVRAQIGITHAINAHRRARKYALAWAPPTCPPEK
jgi:hypothetical protein